LGEALRAVVVDTYALMSKATSEITPKADACLDHVKRGKIKGIIHPLITYEFLLQVYKGRMPIFTASNEALDFLEGHFSTVEISNRAALIAAEVKSKSESLILKLKRHLSVCDAVTIAIAKEWKSPIISGDKDLQAVAEKEHVEIIW